MVSCGYINNLSCVYPGADELFATDSYVYWGTPGSHLRGEPVASGVVHLANVESPFSDPGHLLFCKWRWLTCMACWWPGDESTKSGSTVWCIIFACALWLLLIRATCRMSFYVSFMYVDLTRRRLSDMYALGCHIRLEYVLNLVSSILYICFAWFHVAISTI